MTLRETIVRDLMEAQKKGEVALVSVLRLFIAAIHNKEIEERREASGRSIVLQDEEIEKIARQEIKKRKDAVELYRKGGREDLAKKEEKEIEIFSRYLSPALSEEEVRKEALRVIEEVAAKGKKDFGKVMGVLMRELGSRADGGMVSKIVNELLQ